MAGAAAAGGSAAGAAGSWLKPTLGATLNAQKAQLPTKNIDFADLKVRMFGNSKVIGFHRIIS